MLDRKLLFKLSFIAAAVLSPSFASAYMQQQCNNNLSLSIPDLRPSWEVNAAAVWLQPGASNLNYVIYNKELPAQSPTWIEQEIQPSMKAGFELGLRYVLPNHSGQDLNIDWTHLNSSTSDATTADNVNYFLGPDYEIGPGGIPIRNATGNANFKYDVVNLDAGQYIRFGQNLNVRFFGGLSAGFLREQVNATYSGNRLVEFPGPFITVQNVYSNFTGIGPRAGMSANYDTYCGFGLLGEAAVSALIGSMYSKTSFSSGAQELAIIYNTTVNNQLIKDNRVYQVVPGVDAKLGIDYKHAFRDVLFTVSAGYQAAVYVNAISQYLPGTLVAAAPLESGGIFVATMNHTLSNYSVQGPFLNFAVQV